MSCTAPKQRCTEPFATPVARQRAAGVNISGMDRSNYTCICTRYRHFEMNWMPGFRYLPPGYKYLCTYNSLLDRFTCYNIGHFVSGNYPIAWQHKEMSAVVLLSTACSLFEISVQENISISSHRRHAWIKT